MSNNNNNTGGGGNSPSALGGISPKAWLYIIGIPTILATGYFGLYRPILRKFNILKSPEDKMEEEVSNKLKLQTWWSPTYYVSVNNGIKPLTDTQANSFAKVLHEAMKGGGSWYDWGIGTAESEIMGVFENIMSKAGISQVSEKYYQKYNTSLLADLDSELNSEDFSQIGLIVARYN